MSAAYNNSSSCTPAENVINLSRFGIVHGELGWASLITVVGIPTLLIISILAGNLFVIISIFTYKPLRRVQNYYLVSLAISDITVAIFVLPLNVGYTVMGHWTFGSAVCKIWLTCDIMCCTASILNLCVIALDRLWAATDPVNYSANKSVKKVFVITSSVWILSFLISALPLFGWNDWPDEFDDNTPCRLTSKLDYVIFSSMASFFIPVFVKSTVYFKIYAITRRLLRERANAAKMSIISCSRTEGQSEGNQNAHQRRPLSKNKRRKTLKQKKTASKQKQVIPILPNNDSVINVENLNTSNESSSRETNDVEIEMVPTTSTTVQIQAVHQIVLPPFIQQKQRKYLNRERKAARALGIIFGVFCACWLPFFVTYLTMAICQNCCISTKFVHLVTWLGYSNSSLNPIIYTIFNKDFRNAFKKLILRR